MAEHGVRLDRADVAALLDEVFPEMHAGGRALTLEAITPMAATMRLSYQPRFLRPGGTISGPAMFMLADITMYAAVLGAIGPEPLAVTTNMTINFLRKPAPGDLIAEAKILKLGRRLAVGEIGLHAVGRAELVAHATSTYSLPDARA